MGGSVTTSFRQGRLCAPLPGSDNSESQTRHEASGGGHRPLGIVTRDGNRIGLSHRSDFSRFADAATVRNRVSHGTGALLEEFPELRPQNEPFTGGNGERKGSGHLR